MAPPHEHCLPRSSLLTQAAAFDSKPRTRHPLSGEMSDSGRGRRSRSRSRGRSSSSSSSTPRMSDEQARELINNLRSLIPELRNRPANEVTPERALEEICNHIRDLQNQVGDLSQRIAGQLANMDSAQAAAVRRLLRQLSGGDS
ncbi:Transcription factor [Nymphaea thermarum]|nr:Transcription factor [Nymphaea thermarum]